MSAFVYILICSSLAVFVWPKLGMDLARLLEWLAAEIRHHAIRLDQAYCAYGEDPKPAPRNTESGISRHWRTHEVDELERLYRR